MAIREGALVSPRAQSELVGLLLVIGMALASAGLVVALGSSALDDTQRQASLERAEQSMTLFDSRAALVALGSSPVQQISFGQDDGEFVGSSESGWIRITHANYTGTNDDEVFFNESLGSFVYRNGETDIAYQGGGVWRKDREGTAQLISPPEFHYRRATLTLPIVRLENAESGRAGSTVAIRRLSEARKVFPNRTDATPASNEISAPYDDTDRQYLNPLRNGTVNITVQSEYYHGWAEYFRTRTEGNVAVFPDQKQARVTLESLAGSIGHFDMPAEGNALGVQGMGNDHPIRDFNLTLQPDPHFQNMHWAFYVSEAGEQFELHFFSDGQCAGGSYNGDIDVSIYYYNTSGDTTIHEEWQNTSIDVDDNPDFNLDCGSGDLTIDLMSPTPVTYDDIQLTGSDNKWYFGPEIADRDVAGNTSSFEDHSSDYGDFSRGDKAELGFVIDHYFTYLSPQADLTVVDGPGGSSRVDEGASEGYLTYDVATGGQYITFIHITENRINVTLD